MRSVRTAASRCGEISRPKQRSESVAMDSGGASGGEVLVHQRIVRHEDPVHEREIHAGGGLAAARGGDEHHVGLLERPHGLAVVVLDRELDGLHAPVVAVGVAHPVQAGRRVVAAHAELGLELGEVPAHEVDDGGARPRSSSRTASSTTVRNTIGATRSVHRGVQPVRAPGGPPRRCARRGSACARRAHRGTGSAGRCPSSPR